MYRSLYTFTLGSVVNLKRKSESCKCMHFAEMQFIMTRIAIQCIKQCPVILYTKSKLHIFQDTWYKDVLPGVASDLIYILAGVPQGSILWHFLFLIYINDIVAEICSNIRLVADNANLYIVVGNPATSAACLKSDLTKISIWANNWAPLFKANDIVS